MLGRCQGSAKGDGSSRTRCSGLLLVSRLVPEPDNPHDAHSVAVYPRRGNSPIGYVNKQKARAWSRLIAEGSKLSAVSLRGTGPGAKCDALAVLAAEPRVVAHLLSPRPSSLPQPASLR
ncbi:HIRAN domain-containing protein [Streptomyces sp. NPDC052043]|uniref:HIRAN domain-containing protein n=1 Tax=Streptomyces sp. NPDC052043 TaxID=3365684 RepID=UPI0037D7B203